ncbi:MAG: hypothetical protein LBQ63_06990 [Deltaproteobacteria bacterium]|jgi:hypothetical protein|nr:hypothetical protein [Deltaproteobacteria bacterium]
MPGNILWWAGYIAAGIWLQKLAPGLDALVPGLIVCLQEGNRQQTTLFLLLCILIQEGAGSLPFGQSIIWYGTVMAFYHIGGWFFMAGNFVFILILSLALSLARLLIFLGMWLLQSLPLSALAPPSDFVGSYILQAACIPPLWLLAVKTRRRAESNAN